MHYAERSAELDRLEALAKSLGLSDAVYERILLDVVGLNVEQDPTHTFNEIQNRIYAASTSSYRLVAPHP